MNLEMNVPLGVLKDPNLIARGDVKYLNWKVDDEEQMQYFRGKHKEVKLLR